MPNMADLEERWRAAAHAQAEAKRAFDDTVRQLQGVGTPTQIAASPEVRIVAANLGKAVADWRQTLDELLEAAEEIQNQTSGGDDETG